MPRTRTKSHHYEESVISLGIATHNGALLAICWVEWNSDLLATLVVSHDEIVTGITWIMDHQQYSIHHASPTSNKKGLYNQGRSAPQMEKVKGYILVRK
jgi:hypothetical protein